MNIIKRQLKGIALLGFLYPKNRKIFGNSKPYKLESKIGQNAYFNMYFAYQVLS